MKRLVLYNCFNMNVSAKIIHLSFEQIMNSSFELVNSSFRRKVNPVRGRLRVGTNDLEANPSEQFRYKIMYFNEQVA